MEQYIITLKDNNTYTTELLNCSMEDIVKQYKKKCFKLDKITETRTLSFNSFQKIIENSKTLLFSYGIVILDHYILCEELFVNSIIDYENKTLNYEKLNIYLKNRCNENKRVDALLSITIFQTESYYYDGKNMIPLKFINGFHMIERTDKKSIRECITKSINTLYNMIKPSGRFVYGYFADSGSELNSYNIVRHVGALWSLCLLKDDLKDSNAKERIEKAFDYIINNYIMYKGKKAFVLTDNKHGFRIGGNALFLLALCEYYDKYNDDRYLDITDKVAKGILSCQQPNGCFYHGFDEKLDLTEKNIIVYFDGEAVFALLKYYNICKNDIYYQSVIDAFDYFIENNFEKEEDHWIAHALRELVKYNQDDKYIDFLIQNCRLNTTRHFAPARMEQCISIYGAYSYLKEKKCSSLLLEDFPLRKMLRGIKYRIDYLMCYYISDEVALYLDNHDKTLYGFHCPNDYFRMRIDDIQHSATGLYYYYISDIDVKDNN